MVKDIFLFLALPGNLGPWHNQQLRKLDLLALLAISNYNVEAVTRIARSGDSLERLLNKTAVEGNKYLSQTLCPRPLHSTTHLSFNYGKKPTILMEHLQSASYLSSNSTVEPLLLHRPQLRVGTDSIFQSHRDYGIEEYHYLQQGQAAISPSS